MTEVERFDRLFAGRRDVWGAVHGECKQTPLTTELLREHLFGHGSVGVYPLVERRVVGYFHDGQQVTHGTELVVRWGCSDIDRGVDMIVLARNLHRALRVLGLTAFVERSKGKGYHVWVFAKDWLPAEDMRRALLVAHKLAGVPPTEVNPKQTSLDGLKGFGNYVNLPYAHDWLPQAKRVVLNLDHNGSNPPHFHLGRFLDRAEATLNEMGTIKAAASLWVEPPPESAINVQEYEASADLDPIVARLGGLAFTIFNEGPTERFGYDRSRTLQRLAHLCRESGLNPAETLHVLVDADSRWGKFHARPDGMRQLERMVEYAWR